MSPCSPVTGRGTLPSPARADDGGGGGGKEEEEEEEEEDDDDDDEEEDEKEEDGDWYVFNDTVVAPFDPAQMEHQCFGGTFGTSVSL